MFSNTAKQLNIKSISHNFLKTIIVLFFSTSFAFIVLEASDIKDNIFGIYILAVAIVSSITPGYFWGICTSLAGILGINYFFTFPYFSINFTITGYPLNFVIMLIISIIISALTAKIKKQVLIATAGEKRAQVLYDINKKLLKTTSMEEVIQLALNLFHELLQCSVIFYSDDPVNKNLYKIKLYSPKHAPLLLSDSERQMAQKAFLEKSIVSPPSEDYHLVKGIYIPIANNDTIYGVIGLLSQKENFAERDNIQYMQVMTSQLILAFERQKLFQEQQEILIETEKEKMRSNLLRAVSHDLRTPLTCISGASATLIQNHALLDIQSQEKLLSDIYHDSQWLIHMVENLLSVTRISKETTTVKKSPEAAEEVCAEAVSRIRQRFPNSQIYVQVPKELLMVPMDATLIEQVIINLIENSIRHSQSHAPISLCIKKIPNWAVFEVSDKGIGLSREELPHIFDGYSGFKNSDSSRGIGIGLSICKSIISAHGGMIEAINNTTGGATFRFMLPLEEGEHYE
jgi:two-component system sensor histidine kinase KdpD